MTEDGRITEIRREIGREIQQNAETWRKIGRESATETRIHLAHWRDHVRQRHFNRWLDETARKLGRPANTIQLLGITETQALQDAGFEASYLAAIGQLPHFSREAPIERQGGIELLLKKVRMQISDTPINILRGIASFWLAADQDEPAWESVCANASSYFGAVKATGGEALANAAAWLDEVDFVNSFVCTTDSFDRITLEVGSAHGLAKNPSYDGLACGLDIYGQKWGRLLIDERSDMNYAKSLEQAVTIRAKRHGYIQ